MSSPFIGVCVALYEYQAQNDEELSLQEGDLLYLLEKSDVDDWWKVKKRVVDADVEEPAGLVPSTYVEASKPVNQAVALYDYDKQTEEELTFTEGTIFEVYDNSDPNWILVGVNNDQFGFVPSNYINIGPQQQQQQQAAAISSIPVNNFPPPPQRYDRQQSVPTSTELEAPTPQTPSRPSAIDSPIHDDYDEAPPPMPSRPRGNTATSGRSYASSYDEPVHQQGQGSSENPDDFYKDDFFTWPVHEIDGRKKKKATLAIGNSSIFITPEGSSSARQWSITDLTSYNSEKKHLFLDFKHPSASYELHTGSKDSSEAIVSILADLKGMASMGALKDVKEASIPPTIKKHGKILYDFEAASPDELTCYEGDTVLIINDKKSKEWWMVESLETGEQGVIPSNYIKVVSNKDSGSSSSSKMKSLFTRRSSSSSLSPKKKKSRDRELERDREKKDRQLQREKEELEFQKRLQQKREMELREREQRNREQRERIRRNDDRTREKNMSKSSKSHDASLPNPHRVRTWIDRSGAFKVEAEFLGCSDGKIHLHKVNGVKIAVSAAKLSTEDLEYVERVTGMSLESYKSTKRSSSSRAGPSSPTNVVSSPPPAPSTTSAPSSSSAPPFNERLYEYWFNFFVSCGVDANVCERYARNFSNEQMDESILSEITTSLMRTLGLREGDILRVNKHLDAKFHRIPDTSATSNGNANANAGSGGLFSGADGTLKSNKTGNANEQINTDQLNKQQFDDDAWALKPARSHTDAKSVTPQLTGSIQDLVNIKPIEATKTGNSVQQQQLPIKPVTTTSSALDSTTTTATMQPQKTNGTMMGQMTGAMMPMPTGFMPITMIPMMTGQATGMMGLQPTGLMMNKTGQLTTGFPMTSFGQQQKTGGGMNLLPLATGSMPLTSFGQIQKTGGGFGSMPITSFGAGLPQPTGGLISLQPTGLTINKTGLMGQQQQPITSFGQPQPQTIIPLQQPTGVQLNSMFPSMQPTMKTGGGFIPQQQMQQPIMKTGGFIPQSNFGTAMMTGGLQQQQQQPMTSFGVSNPMNSFGGMGQQTGTTPMTSFGGGQPTGGYGMNQLNNMFQQTSISQPQPQPQQTGFMNMNTGYQQQQQQQPQQQQQMNGFGGGMQTGGFNSFNPQQQQQQQMQMQSFQPLASQPTGLGFGNAPNTSFGVGGGLQSQQTGRRANLANATADNPFGF
ncbi:hypothetical protein CANARDRAFT_28517 [[Candida] arabinofermentans NRRL YB-2248]|uniref:Actin cytoskeleton-regulatory complex protein SLA1 n=1 Tax=[Candida] arabinofermentans NRRL YB-2248 TaxID=983967 RepID=A0A1E4T0G6_9ASCO|nr:hypothetical protein CANARDRAFT_28517 [[Candida] arabinofermentans NRRL YB-2248]